jgi:uncharacterized phage-associated protein
MTTPVFDFDKTINSALYVAEKIKTKDLHKIFKILYFADRGHLVKYGRPITGDTYIKMNNGPVPTNLYNIFQSIRENKSFHGRDMKEYFTVYGGYFVNPEKKTDLEYLSITDTKELDISIAKYGRVPFGLLTAISHDIAWEYAEENKAIAIENILREAGEDEEYISYIVEDINFQKALM